MLSSLQDYMSGWRGEVVVATALCLLLSRYLHRRQKNNDIPTATGSIPLLGHALAYQQDPATFLSSQKIGGVFRIHLAGRTMIVVSDKRAMKQVAIMPESAMSARQAVADVGFEYTLGLRNVHKGTDWHKRILKDYVYNNNNTTNKVLPAIFQCMVEAFDQETNSKHKMDDLFVVMRRCMLRAMLTYMIAPSLLDDNERFLDDFMHYQDLVEDATAKAAVLPRFLSVPLVLRPVQQRREQLTLQLASMIEEIWKNNNESSILGPWLTAFQKDDMDAEEAAELTIGLMFAAHKNPAIGVSQSLCYLQTEATVEQQDTAMSEAKKLYDSYSNGGKTPQESPTLRHCILETLRLTAHSIGGIRTAQKDFVLGTSNGTTYSIQKGDVICISHICTHRDALIWGNDACDYRQDRWQELEKNDVTIDEYKYTTFSHGVHKCPGERLALSMMEMMLAILLVRNVQLVDDKNTLPKVSFERATLAQRDGNVPITIGVVARA